MERELSTLSPSPLPPLLLLRLLALSLTSFFPIQKANMNDGGERGAAGRRAAAHGTFFSARDRCPFPPSVMY